MMLPSSGPDFAISRSVAPASITTRLSRSARSLACVPLPEPWGPRKIRLKIFEAAAMFRITPHPPSPTRGEEKNIGKVTLKALIVAHDELRVDLFDSFDDDRDHDQQRSAADGERLSFGDDLHEKRQ